MDTNEKIRAKLVGLSRSSGLEPYYGNSELWRRKRRKDCKAFRF